MLNIFGFVLITPRKELGLRSKKRGKRVDNMLKTLDRPKRKFHQHKAPFFFKLISESRREKNPKEIRIGKFQPGLNTLRPG